MKKQRRSSEDTNVSFLDIICCGFGAIVLLLVIVQSGQIEVLEESDNHNKGRIRALQEQLFTLRGEVEYLERDLTAKQEQLDSETEAVAILRGQLEEAQQNLIATQASNIDENEELQDLQIAYQTLTAEMRRLLGDFYSRKDNIIGGIPVDSEYIIFIIDTSGSMHNFAWNRVVQEISSILDIYPNVKGLQIMNDMGNYMFSSYRGKWIEDEPYRRRIILDQLRGWRPFSNSSPVEGITAAIRQFYSEEKKISLYVFGDDYSGRRLAPVLDVVRSLNRGSEGEDPNVRIHAVGFPVQFAAGSASGVRFAALMRELAHQNAGTFVGLNDFR